MSRRRASVVVASIANSPQDLVSLQVTASRHWWPPQPISSPQSMRKPCLDDQGKYSEAEPLYRKALEIDLKVLGELYPDTAIVCNNLALNLKDQGKYREAEPLFRKALEMYRKALGERHPGTVLSHNNMAINLHAQGKYREAESLSRKALALCRNVHGES